MNDYYNQETGEWRRLKNYDPNTAVNGTMKICMALRIINKLDYIKATEKIIDRSLELTTGAHACDNFNVLYVLYLLHTYLWAVVIISRMYNLEQKIKNPFDTTYSINN